MTTSRPTGRRVVATGATTGTMEKGIATAALNVVLIAAGLATQQASSNPGDLFVFSLVVGLTPGLTAGVLLGWLAGHLTRYRFFALTALAFAILAITGALAGSEALVAYGSVPLLASVAVLERITRR